MPPQQSSGPNISGPLREKHGQGKALTVWAHTLARAVYDMVTRDVVFDLDIFLQSYGRE